MVAKASALRPAVQGSTTSYPTVALPAPPACPSPQAVYPNGTQVFCEQISHHPPISSWEVYEPNGLVG